MQGEMYGDDDGGSTRWRVLQAIEIFISEHGYGPSVRDIRQMTGLSSTGHVGYHLDALQAVGRITRAPGIARSIRVVGAAHVAEKRAAL